MTWRKTKDLLSEKEMKGGSMSNDLDGYMWVKNLEGQIEQ